METYQNWAGPFERVIHLEVRLQNIMRQFGPLDVRQMRNIIVFLGRTFTKEQLLEMRFSDDDTLENIVFNNIEALYR